MRRTYVGQKKKHIKCRSINSVQVCNAYRFHTCQAVFDKVCRQRDKRTELLIFKHSGISFGCRTWGRQRHNLLHVQADSRKRQRESRGAVSAVQKSISRYRRGDFFGGNNNIADTAISGKGLYHSRYKSVRHVFSDACFSGSVIYVQRQNHTDKRI